MSLDIIFPKVKPSTAIKRKPPTKPLPKTQIHEVKETAPIMENKENVEAQENKNVAANDTPIKSDENLINYTEDPAKPTENPSKEIENIIKSSDNIVKENEVKSNEINKIPENLLEKIITTNVDITNEQKPAREREKSKFPVVGYSDEENMW